MTLLGLMAEHRFQWRTAGTWCECGWGGVSMHHVDYDNHLADLIAPYVGCKRHAEKRGLL